MVTHRARRCSSPVTPHPRGVPTRGLVPDRRTRGRARRILVAALALAGCRDPGDSGAETGSRDTAADTGSLALADVAAEVDGTVGSLVRVSWT